MASMNSLRTAFSSLAVGTTSHSVKGKARNLDSCLNLTSSSRTLSSHRIAQTPSAGPSSQPSSAAATLTATATASTSASTSNGSTPSLSSGPLPTSPVTSTSQALELLRAQPHHYVVASLTGRTFLLAASDLVTVPRLKGVAVGDVLELDRVHEVGSRDYTLRAQDPMHCRTRSPSALMRRSVLTGEHSQLASAVSAGTSSGIAHQVSKVANSWATRLHPAGLAHVGAVLDPQTVRVRAVVVEHTKGAMERIVKKKRRKGYKKTIQHKQPYTRIRIDRIDIAPRDA